MYRKYQEPYGVSHPAPRRVQKPEIIVPKKVVEVEKKAEKEKDSPLGLFKNLLGDFKFDDILLVGLIILLLTDDSDDHLLLIVLGYLLISDMDLDFLNIFKKKN